MDGVLDVLVGIVMVPWGGAGVLKMMGKADIGQCAQQRGVRVLCPGFPAYGPGC